MSTQSIEVTIPTVITETTEAFIDADLSDNSGSSYEEQGYDESDESSESESSEKKEETAEVVHTTSSIPLISELVTKIRKDSRISEEELISQDLGHDESSSDDLPAVVTPKRYNNSEESSEEYQPKKVKERASKKECKFAMILENVDSSELGIYNAMQDISSLMRAERLYVSDIIAKFCEEKMYKPKLFKAFLSKHKSFICHADIINIALCPKKTYFTALDSIVDLPSLGAPTTITQLVKRYNSKTIQRLLSKQCTVWKYILGEASKTSKKRPLFPISTQDRYTLLEMYAQSEISDNQIYPFFQKGASLEVELYHRFSAAVMVKKMRGIKVRI